MRASWIAVYEPLMGTTVEVRVWADEQPAAKAAEAAVVEEVQRLTAVFSGFDASSELCRWARGDLDDVSTDLANVLELAQHWFAESDGAFSPVCRALYDRWEHAVADQVVPDPAELLTLAKSLVQSPFHVKRQHGTPAVHRLRDCRGVDLNALAKGYIVDRAAERAAALSGVHSVLVNAGGDLRHTGPGSITVRIEDPHHPFDNAEPLTRVAVSAAALATSGTVHRGFRVGERWFGHVLDPRTGWPVRHTASASVIAPDAATADAVATIAMVLPPEEAVVFADQIDGVAALLVEQNGSVHRSPRWPDPPRDPATRPRAGGQERVGRGLTKP